MKDAAHSLFQQGLRASLLYKVNLAVCMRDGYDVAQICRRGHVATSACATGPEFRKKHCPECGSPTITQCESCKHNIRGMYHGGFIRGGYDPPNFCENCGQPFPWMADAIQAANELALELEGLDAKEIAQLQASIEDIVRDTPRTKLAVARIKKLMARAKGEAASAMTSQLVSMATEEAKKLLLGSIGHG